MAESLGHQRFSLVMKSLVAAVIAACCMVDIITLAVTARSVQTAANKLSVAIAVMMKAQVSKVSQFLKIGFHYGKGVNDMSKRERNQSNQNKHQSKPQPHNAVNAGSYQGIRPLYYDGQEVYCKAIPGGKCVVLSSVHPDMLENELWRYTPPGTSAEDATKMIRDQIRQFEFYMTERDRKFKQHALYLVSPADPDGHPIGEGSLYVIESDLIPYDLVT